MHKMKLFIGCEVAGAPVMDSLDVVPVGIEGEAKRKAHIAQPTWRSVGAHVNAKTGRLPDEHGGQRSGCRPATATRDAALRSRPEPALSAGRAERLLLLGELSRGLD
jgi:hypothetical protein